MRWRSIPGVEAIGEELLGGALSRAVLELHMGIRDWPPDAFQERAFEVVRRLIPFDSGMWGTASNDPHRMHSVHLDHQPREMIEEYIAGFQEIDPMRDRVSAMPGVSVNLSDFMTREQLLATRIYSEYMRKWGLEWVLCTVQIEPVSSLIGFISLWRRDPARPFSETERRVKQFLVPHLMHAHRESRVRQMRAAAHRGNASQRASAICDRFGVLHLVEEPFVRLVQAEWRQWRSAQLPGPLSRLIERAQGGVHRGAAAVFRASPVGDLVLLEGRTVKPIDRLTAREREVAQHYAQGRTNQEIARTLRISAATVRNHLRKLYGKLDIANKTQLIRQVDEGLS
jgi:DNA-binding CsgD family transcriptional regulator